MRMTLELDAETQGLLQSYGFDRDLFERLRARLRSGEMTPEANRLTSPVQPPHGEDIRLLPASGVPERVALHGRGAAALRAQQVGCVILAGGMATRFGGVVKAEVEALPGRSFLALKLADVRRAAREAEVSIPVYVMSSFATHAALLAMAEANQSAEAPIEVFPQFVSLRLNGDGSLFLGDDQRPSPYAPGHGDLSFALRRSGVLKRFLGQGGRVLTVSNVDNLGATLDAAVIGAHLEAGVEMTVEVGRRTPGELGGIPARVDGKLQIVEDFRLPKAFDPSSIPFFNTNTFVFDASVIDREFPLSWFVVHKRVDGRPAIQFEHLVGQLSAFLSCVGLEVARDGQEGRFQPVKDPEELALRRPQIEWLLRARGVI
jgi:UTP--glucose-1-phosphate uridylyltransferase